MLHFRHFLLLALGIWMVAADAASGQFVRRRRVGVVLGPPAYLHIGPISVPGPRLLLQRRRAALSIHPLDPQLPPHLQPSPRGAARPVPADANRAADDRAGEEPVQPVFGGPAPTPAGRGNSGASRAQPVFPTEAVLRSMTDAELLNALLDASYRLHERLERLTTGAGWQRHLRLPDDALPPPSPSGQVELGMKSLKATLARFNRVAANPEYVKISSLPSFVATHNALRQVVIRFDVPGEVDGLARQANESPTVNSADLDAAGRETLPAPQPDPVEAEPEPGIERSVLKRTTRS